MDGDENFGIDPEIWLMYLLAVNGDVPEKEEACRLSLRESRDHS